MADWLHGNCAVDVLFCFPVDPKSMFVMTLKEPVVNTANT